MGTGPHNDHTTGNSTGNRKMIITLLQTVERPSILVHYIRMNWLFWTVLYLQVSTFT